MRIAIDIHGTIDRDPKFWNKIIDMFHAMCADVYILSGPERDKIVGRLISLNINIHKLKGILSMADWIKNRTDAHYWYVDGNFWTDKETWNKTKAVICSVKMIDVIIDDKLEYFHPEIAPYTLFMTYHPITGFRRVEGESTEPDDIDSASG
jgi:hypothetical protein